MFSETSFDNSFSEFRQTREMRYGTIVCEIFLIKTRGFWTVMVTKLTAMMSNRRATVETTVALSY